MKPVLQRQPNYRSRALLDLSHSAPCMAEFEHECSEYQGVEPAHSDQQKHGRGHSYKSHDCVHAAMCHTAHLMLDTFESDVKDAEFDRAFVKTLVWYFTHGYLVVNRKGRIAA